MNPFGTVFNYWAVKQKIKASQQTYLRKNVGAFHAFLNQWRFLSETFQSLFELLEKFQQKLYKTVCCKFDTYKQNLRYHTNKTLCASGQKIRKPLRR